MKEQHAAVLIAGSEDRFISSINAMNDYLGALGIRTSVLRFEHTSVVLDAITRMSSLVTTAGVLLVVIDAHGSEDGIETPSSLNRLTYRKIVDAVGAEERRVQFVTSTCYGQFLIKYLIGRRSGLSTGVITTWEGFATTYDNTTKDVLSAWSQNMLPEKMIERQIYSGGVLPYDSEFMAVQRWGAIHDDTFFSSK